MMQGSFQDKTFLERVEEFMEGCLKTNNIAFSSASPVTSEKIERIRQAFVTIHREVIEIENMLDGSEREKIQRFSEREKIQPEQISSERDFLEYLDQIMRCRPCP